MPEITQIKLTEPAASGWVRRFAGLVAPGGSVLDIACGGGRHARLFLRHGHAVTGVDRSLDGVRDLAGRPDFEPVPADLEDGSPWPLPGRRFDAVMVTNYLHRPLLPRLPGLLAAGGVLIYETFAVGNEAHGRPRNPDFLLRPGELIAALGDALTVVAYEHGLIHRPAPAVVQRICAVATRPGAVELDAAP